VAGPPVRLEPDLSLHTGALLYVLVRAATMTGAPSIRTEELLDKVPLFPAPGDRDVRKGTAQPICNLFTRY